VTPTRRLFECSYTLDSCLKRANSGTTSVTSSSSTSMVDMPSLNRANISTGHGASDSDCIATDASTTTNYRYHRVLSRKFKQR
jgi:hypothetical protein